ncbi:MAG: hypothetical protein JSU65_02920 [Candidatus Zixiibacteriota bacterium]|nr:MAG: hypothetical protein JSU65_02920 [candidate division Zixibacteria bacterium]
MISKPSMIARLPAALAVIFALSGCGYDPADPPYDTANNPENYPRAAIQLLDNLENDRLGTFEEIAEAFASLYTENSSLLDNENWKIVIDRLGQRLKYRADEEAESGVEGYTRAADFYALGSFACPEDTDLQHLNELFAAWKRQEARFPNASRMASLAFQDRLDILRSLYFTELLGPEFIGEHLAPHLVENRAEFTRALAGLSAADRAFLCVTGLTDTRPDTALAEFSEPKIDLVAVRVLPLEENIQLAELYFYPHESVQSDLSVALRVHTVDSSLRSPADDLRFIPFDFDPEMATSDWAAGHLTVAHRTMFYSNPVTDVSIGLMDRNSEPVRYLTPEGGDDRLARLSLPSEGAGTD